MPIRERAVVGSVDPHISYSQKYSEFDACIDCGLDLWAWWNGGYTTKFKANVLAFHRLRSLVRLHTEDALSQAQKRRMKNKD